MIQTVEMSVEKDVEIVKSQALQGIRKEGGCELAFFIPRLL